MMSSSPLSRVPMSPSPCHRPTFIHSQKICYGSPSKWMSNFTKLHLTNDIFWILPVFSFTILVKFDIHFLGLLWAIWKKKRNSIFFKLLWYKVFVHWKLKLLNFLVDSVSERSMQSKPIFSLTTVTIRYMGYGFILQKNSTLNVVTPLKFFFSRTTRVLCQGKHNI